MASVHPHDEYRRRGGKREQLFVIAYTKGRRPDGSLRRTSMRFWGNVTGAENEADRLHLQYEVDNDLPEPGEETTAEVGLWWLDRYKTEKRVRGKTVEEESFDAAKREILHLIDVLGADHLFSTLTEADAKRLPAERKKLVYRGTDGDGERIYEPSDEMASAGTINRAIGVWTGFFREAHEEGYHQRDLGKALKQVSDGPVTGDDEGKVVVYSMEDMRRFAAHLDEPTQEVKSSRKGTPFVTHRPRWLNVYDPARWRPSDRFWFFSYTGLSFSEGRGVLPEDIVRRILRLRRTIKRRNKEPRGYGKTDARMDLRRVPLPEDAMPILDRLVDYSRCGYLITGPDGEMLAYHTWSKQMANTAEATGIALTTHGLRHFATSLWIASAVAAGRDWRWPVMKAGGWSDLKMMERTYGHVFEDTLEQMGVDLDDYLKRVERDQQGDLEL